MDERSDIEKVDEVMLPGFRFHPTDEELVGFYLKRKIQQRPLSIELIKQLDIYKFDPWDLPKLATTGEKEWYFYCPRDRKYRNSARPNRVTGGGFWKATGTDRPIYSSESSKCIGLKKSLVFYRGRAAKGIKTDWMMHEFRLPSIVDLAPDKTDKNLLPNDSWAICRIFKKTNSMAQRALSRSWVSQTPENICSDISSHPTHGTQFTFDNISSTAEVGSSIQFCRNDNLQPPPAIFSLDIPSYKPINPTVCKPAPLSISNVEIPPGFMFSPLNISMSEKSNINAASMLPNLSPTILGDVSKDPTSLYFGLQHQYNDLAVNSPPSIDAKLHDREDEASMKRNVDISRTNNQWGTVRSDNFPFNLPSTLSDAWKTNFPWDSLPCPSEMSTICSTNKCYT